AMRRGGAGVVDGAVADGKDPAVFVYGDLLVVALAALLGGGDQVLAAVLRPLDGPAEPDRREGHQDLLRVKEHDLGPEASTDVGGDDVQLAFGEPEHTGEAVLDGQRGLGGDPHPQGPRTAVVLGRDAPSLDRAPAAPLDVEPFTEHARGVRQGAGGVPDL